MKERKRSSPSSATPKVVSPELLKQRGKLLAQLAALNSKLGLAAANTTGTEALQRRSEDEAKVTAAVKSVLKRDRATMDDVHAAVSKALRRGNVAWTTRPAGILGVENQRWVSTLINKVLKQDPRAKTFLAAQRKKIVNASLGKPIKMKAVERMAASMMRANLLAGKPG